MEVIRGALYPDTSRRDYSHIDASHHLAALRPLPGIYLQLVFLQLRRSFFALQEHKVKCAGHATDLKGDENNVSESRKSRNDRNLKAESKGVTSDRGSEGSRRRKFVVTYRNRIKGLSSRVTGLQTRTPDSHSEGRGVNPAQQMERSVAYPGRPLRVPGNRIGRRVTAGRKA